MKIFINFGVNRIDIPCWIFPRFSYNLPTVKVAIMSFRIDATMSPIRTNELSVCLEYKELYNLIQTRLALNLEHEVERSQTEALLHLIDGHVSCTQQGYGMMSELY